MLIRHDLGFGQDNFPETGQLTRHRKVLVRPGDVERYEGDGLDVVVKEQPIVL